MKPPNPHNLQNSSDIEEGNESLNNFEYLCSECDFEGTEEEVYVHGLQEHPDKDIKPIKNKVLDASHNGIYTKEWNNGKSDKHNNDNEGDKDNNAIKKINGIKGNLEINSKLPTSNKKEEIIKAFIENLTIEEQLKAFTHNVNSYPNNNNSIKGEDYIHTVNTYILQILDRLDIDGYEYTKCINALSLQKKAKTEIPTIIASQNIFKAVVLAFVLRYKNIYSNLLDPILGSYKGNPSSYRFALTNLEKKGFLIHVDRGDNRFFEERTRLIRVLKKSRRSTDYNEKQHIAWFIISPQGEEEIRKYINNLMGILPDEVRKRLSSDNPLPSIVGRTHEEVEKQAQKREFDAKKTNLRIQEIEKEVNVTLSLQHRPKLDLNKEITNRLVARKIKPPFTPQIRLEIAEEILKEAKEQ